MRLRVFLFFCLSHFFKCAVGLRTETFLAKTESEARNKELPLIYPRIALQLKSGYHSSHGTSQQRARHRTRVSKAFHPCRHLKEKERTACELKWDVSLLHEKTIDGVPKGGGARTHVSITLEHD